MKAPDPCPCGQPLPWHLFALGMGLQHTCSCGRAFKEVAGQVLDAVPDAADKRLRAAFDVLEIP